MSVYEGDRLAALEERRRDDAESGTARLALEKRFGPGSFGCHEALHVTHLIVDLIERELTGHSAVLLDPSWYARVREAQALLYSAYNDVAQGHLGVPRSQDAGGS